MTDLGILKNMRLTSKIDSETGMPKFTVVLEVEPKSLETIELVQHLADGETLKVNLEVLQPTIFGKKKEAKSD